MHAFLRQMEQYRHIPLPRHHLLIFRQHILAALSLESSPSRPAGGPCIEEFDLRFAQERLRERRDTEEIRLIDRKIRGELGWVCFRERMRRVDRGCEGTQRIEEPLEAPWGRALELQRRFSTQTSKKCKQRTLRERRVSALGSLESFKALL